MGQLNYTTEEVSNLLDKVKAGGGNTGSSNIVIPDAVLNLTEDSSSEEILAAFGGKDGYLSFIQSAITNKDGACVAVANEGDSNAVYTMSMITASYTDENNSFLQIVAIIMGSSTSFSISMSDGQACFATGYEEFLFDAPNDGKTYGRFNGSWKAIETIGGESDNTIVIPPGITELTPGSSSDEIFAAFGGKNALISLCERAQKENVVCMMKMPGRDTDVAAYIPFNYAADYVDVDNAFFSVMFQTGGATQMMQIDITDGIASFGNASQLYMTNESVVNNLISTSDDNPLSAAMGKKLNDEKVGSPDVRTMKIITQSEYDSATKDNKTLYIITDTGRIYLGAMLIITGA